MQNFDYSLSTRDRGEWLGYNVSIGVTSANLSAPYQLSNSFLAMAVSTLGTLFDHTGNAGRMEEFDFGVSIADARAYPRVLKRAIIARGYVIQPSVLSDN